MSYDENNFDGPTKQGNGVNFDDVDDFNNPLFKAAVAEQEAVAAKERKTNLE